MKSFLLKPFFHSHGFGKFNSILDLLIYYMLLIFSLVDCVTGLFLQSGLPSIGVPYKLLLMLLMTLSIKSFNKITLFIYFLILFSFCGLIYLFLPYTDLSTSLSMILKIMMYPCILLYFYDTYKKNPQGAELIERICFYNFITIVVNQILGILGYGFSTYNDGGFGIKGFYYDGNAMAVVCFCLFVFYFSIKKNSIFALILAICSVILGTKTSILAIFLYFFAVKFKRANLKIKVTLCILLGVTFFVLFYFINFTDMFSYHVAKIKRMYELFDGNILAVILSGRNIDLANHTQFYKEHFSISQLLFGYGYRKYVKIIELDFFDTLYSYGLLFCTLILIMYIYPIFYNRKYKEVVIFNILVLLITFASGHVWYNTSTALFLVINNFYYSIRKENEKNILHN